MLALALASVAAASLLTAGCNRGVEREPRAAGPIQPSVVAVIVLDTVRADAITPRDAPAITALGRSGVVYSRARSPAPLTMPAMAAAFTGLYPHKVGVFGHSRRDRVSPRAPLLGVLARRAGYRTVAVVTNPWLANRQTGFTRGFDSFTSGRTLSAGRTRLAAPKVAGRALEELARNDPRPLFLWLHFMDAHMPYGDGDAPTAVTEDFAADAETRSRIFFGARGYDREQIDATVRAYERAVRTIDDAVSSILQALPDDALVLLFADHGEALGEHGLFFAHDFTLREELLRVPLVLRAPGIASGLVVDEPVSLLDVLPTLCALAVLDCPEALDGDRLPGTGVERVAGNAKREDSSRLFFAASARARKRYACPWLTVPGERGRLTAVIRNGRKLVRTPAPAGVIEYRAFDLRRDPGETTDVFDWSLDTELVRILEEWSIEAATSSPAAPARLPAGTARELRELGYLD